MLREFGNLFDAIHASPPCQRYCAPSQYNGNRDTYPDFVGPIRAALEASGKPYVIENTPGAPLRNPTILCGTMFGLRVYRHRLFESNVPLAAPDHPKHKARCARNGVIPPADGFFTITGGKHSKAWVRAAAEAMSMSWAGDDLRGVCEAVPPDYTLHIGRQLLRAVIGRRDRDECRACADPRFTCPEHLEEAA